MEQTLEEQIQSLEKVIDEQMQLLHALKKQRAGNTVVQNAVFTTKNGAISLSDLFGEKQDLILVHNMGKACSYCTMWADGFNGVARHLSSRAAFALVSPDDVETQIAFANERGWNFTMLSSQGTTFTHDMGFAYEKNDKTFYVPGYSTFYKDSNGTITRVGYDYFGPGDVYCSPWQIFEQLQGGAGSWNPQ